MRKKKIVFVINEIAEKITQLERDLLALQQTVKQNACPHKAISVVRDEPIAWDCVGYFLPAPGFYRVRCLDCSKEWFTTKASMSPQQRAAAIAQGVLATPPPMKKK